MFVGMERLSELNTESCQVQLHPLHVQDAPLKLSDKVIFYAKDGMPLNGIVRWIGRNKDIMKNGSKIVGIETVSFYYCIHSYG